VPLGDFAAAVAGERAALLNQTLETRIPEGIDETSAAADE
jgi:hypothetical protein